MHFLFWNVNFMENASLSFILTRFTNKTKKKSVLHLTLLKQFLYEMKRKENKQKVKVFN